MICRPLTAWPGGGSPNIYQVRADFLDSLASGAPPPAGSGATYRKTESASAVSFPDLSGPYLGQEPPGRRAGHVRSRYRQHRFERTGYAGPAPTAAPSGTASWGRGWSPSWKPAWPMIAGPNRCRSPFHRDEEFCLLRTDAFGRREDVSVPFQSRRPRAGAGDRLGQPEHLPQPPGRRGLDRARGPAGAGHHRRRRNISPAWPPTAPSIFPARMGSGRPAIWAAEPEGDGFAEPAAAFRGGQCGPEQLQRHRGSGRELAHRLRARAMRITSGSPTTGSVSGRRRVGWLPAVNMGDRFNGPGLRASSVSLSPDGRYLFFSTNRKH